MYSVIIVDDEALSRYALHVMLSKNMPDLNVAAECEDGASAVQAALRYKPDIVIIDIKMPGMNGLTASKKMCIRDSPLTGSQKNRRPEAFLR